MWKEGSGGRWSLIEGEERKMGCGKKRVPELSLEPLLDRGQGSELESGIHDRCLLQVSGVLR